MQKLFFSLTLIFLFACQTGGVVIHDTPLNISETRKVVSSIIGQPRLVSENGRELDSRYFDRTGHYPDNIEKAKERLHTVVTILGDRRPYDIHVEVLIEIKVQEERYELYDRDDRMAAGIAQRIKAALYESQSKRNVIDDFKPM